MREDGTAVAKSYTLTQAEGELGLAWAFETYEPALSDTLPQQGHLPPDLLSSIPED